MESKHISVKPRISFVFLGKVNIARLPTHTAKCQRNIELIAVNVKSSFCLLMRSARHSLSLNYSERKLALSLWVNCRPKGTLWMASCCANRLVTGGKASTALNELRDSFNGAATGQMANVTYRYQYGVWYMDIICPTTLAKMSGSRCDWECNFETLSADTLTLYTNTTHTHTHEYICIELK